MASFIVYGDASGQVTVKAPAVAGSNTITFPAETGTLVTTASTTMPNTIVWDTTVKTSGFTAAIDGGYFCNTTGGAFTVTLPAAPARGDFVVIVDYAGTSATNNITVSGNGGNINGTTGNIIISTNRQGLTLTYIDSTQGWLASSNVYGGATPFTQQIPVSYLVVAGGGGGGGNTGGGGGGGGLLTGTATLNSGTVYTATVGGGGGGTTGLGTNGSNSVLSGSGISTQTAIGGGAGGTYISTAGTSGGSGGGGGGGTNAGGSGTSGQGNAGGAGLGAPNYPSGGGGGAGAVGLSGSTSGGGIGGNAGIGLQSSITGSSVYYAGGGGGKGDAVAGTGTVSTGGGANGVAGNTANTTPATANTGGGGGGGGGGGNTGSNGGSGVVILSVPTSRYSGTTTGSPTVTTSGSNTIIRFTASGTYTA
jgi:hypothetical protein